MDEKKQIEEMAQVIDDASEFTIEGITNAIIKCKIVGIKLAAKLYNAGYRKQNEWISVDERLPERLGYYLAYTTRGTIEIARFYPYYVDDKPQFDYWITHWMPLPEPPKKGGAE